MEIVHYSDKLKQSVFSFTDACFSELGKKFEPEGRHASYNDIENTFEVFFCLTIDNDQVIGTVALKKLDDNTAELKALYLDRRYRGQGLGKLLIDTIIGEARTSDFKCHPADYKLPLPSDCFDLKMGADTMTGEVIGSFSSY